MKTPGNNDSHKAGVLLVFSKKKKRLFDIAQLRAHIEIVAPIKNSYRVKAKSDRSYNAQVARFNHYFELALKFQYGYYNDTGSRRPCH